MQFLLYLNIFKYFSKSQKVCDFWPDPDPKSELQKIFFTFQIQKIKDFYQRWALKYQVSDKFCKPHYLFFELWLFTY